MNWFLIVLLCLLYLVLGGATHKFLEKSELDKEIELLKILEPIYIILLWPVIVIAGVFILVVVGAAFIGELLMDKIFKFFSSSEKEKEKK